MPVLSKRPRFVLVFDDGGPMRSATVRQDELPDTIRRLCMTGFRINDVQPMASEWDEEQQFQESQRAFDAEGIFG